MEDVQRELADAVKGRRVVSDAVTADTYWLGVLHELSPLPFRIERLADFLRPATGLAGMAAREKVVAAMEEARRRYPREHRAEPDARRWAETFRILMGLA